jgi:hypothetical protein
LAFACFLLSYIEGMSAVRTFAVRPTTGSTLTKSFLRMAQSTSVLDSPRDTRLGAACLVQPLMTELALALH